ncbi:MAG: response regulator [Dehalococcoidia bacterium]
MAKKIMLADDEETILALVSATLSKDEQYKVLTARDGQEALDVARREKPDILFLDILMPKIDGFEVCKMLKEDPATSDITIIMLTALVQEVDRTKALEAGADDYFTKPFSPTELLMKVDEVLGPNPVNTERKGPETL